MSTSEWPQAGDEALYEGKPVEVVRFAPRPNAKPCQENRRCVIRSKPSATGHPSVPFKPRTVTVYESRLDRPADSRIVAREAWIRKYIGMFGEPSQLAAYRAREISFDVLYQSAIRSAENMVTEVQNCLPDAFDAR